MPPPRNTRNVKVLNGFTLAEVLITLGIIGVVAAMTMPSLIANHKEKQTIVALKKFYTVLEQAIKMNQIDNDESFSSEDIVKQFKTLKVCTIPDKTCAPENYKYLNGTTNDNWGNKDIWTGVTYALLVDGTIIRYSSGNACTTIRGTTLALSNVCGEFSVDINGNKLPNILGKDVFLFNITRYGVVPFGTEDENIYKFSTTCKENSSGYGCTSWVLVNENIDYLHCNDLDWNTKTKCK